MNIVTVTTIGIEELKQIIEDSIENKLSIYLNKNTEIIPEVFEQELITRKELAKKLRISLPTLNTLTKSGTIISYRVGRRVLYKWNEVNLSLQKINYSKYKRKDLK